MKRIFWKAAVLLGVLCLLLFAAAVLAESDYTGIKLDAVVECDNGKVYFFKGDQYVRYDVKADRIDPGYPKLINNETWPGMPWTAGIDAAVNWKNGKAYFFNGNQYVRYDVRADRVDSGYPKVVNDQNWPGLPYLFR